MHLTNSFFQLTETGVLRVTLNGVQEDLMDTIALPRTIDFQMDKSLMFFGGLPPDYHERFVANARLLNRRPFNSFLGQMRAITIVSFYIGTCLCKTFVSTYLFSKT